jgi:hypothetical protein
MRSLVLAAGLAVAMSTGAAFAADLDDDGPPPYRRGSAYDDPRYSDIYRYPDRPPPPAYVAPRPPAAVYRDEDDDYGPPPRRYPGAGYAAHCVPRAEIKHRLLSEGWRDFHDPDLRGDLASVRARRPSGRLFDLTIDRCTGQIVNARPLEPRPYGPYASRFYGPYAYGAPPRRWERPY